MKKIILSLVICLLSLCLFSCGQNDKEIRLGFDAEYPPYGYMENGEYVGFDIEYAALVAEKIGYSLKLVPIAWEAKDAELEAGTINCIWSGFTINGREELYEWTTAYADNSIVVLVKKDSGITTLADLKDKVVTVQSDSSGEKALLEEEKEALVASFKKFNRCSDYNTAIMELESEAIDAIAIDISVAKFYMKNEPGKYEILTEAISSEKYGVGFKLGNTELKDLVNQAMLDLAAEGKVDPIAEKYGLTDSICIGK